MRFVLTPLVLFLRYRGKHDSIHVFVCSKIVQLSDANACAHLAVDTHFWCKYNYVYMYECIVYGIYPDITEFI